MKGGAMETTRSGQGYAPEFDRQILASTGVVEREEFSTPPKMLIAVKNRQGKVYRLIAANNADDLRLAMQIMLELGMVDDLADEPKNWREKLVRFFKYGRCSFAFRMPAIPHRFN
jgi:hypothetical protein